MRLLLSAFLLLYLCFPSHNPTIDSWGYAASVKWGAELLHPHHLLYNVLGFGIKTILEWFGLQVNALRLMQAINALATVALLAVVHQTLRETQLRLIKKERQLWVVLAGVSFGIWRFATENETYILPILLSAIGSLYWWKWLRNGKQKGLHLFLTGLFAAMACLFHQIHFWWWLGLGIGTIWEGKRLSSIVIFSLSAFIVPIAYFLAARSSGFPETISGIVDYALHAYSSGMVEPEFGFKNILLAVINTVRTFLQAHGQMLRMLQHSPLWLLPGLAALILFVTALLKLRITRYQPDPEQKSWNCVHLFILCLHWLFALFSVGNAEFLVMLPVLAVVLLPIQWQFRAKSLIPVALGMTIWNFAYGIWPVCYFHFDHYSQMVSHVQAHPNALYLLNNRALLVNQLHYQDSAADAENIFYTPSEWEARGFSRDSLFMLVKEHWPEVYIEDERENHVLNRAAIVKGGGQDDKFLEGEVVAVYTVYTGKVKLRRMVLPQIPAP